MGKPMRANSLRIATASAVFPSPGAPVILTIMGVDSSTSIAAVVMVWPAAGTTGKRIENTKLNFRRLLTRLPRCSCLDRQELKSTNSPALAKPISELHTQSTANCRLRAVRRPDSRVAGNPCANGSVRTLKTTGHTHAGCEKGASADAACSALGESTSVVPSGHDSQVGTASVQSLLFEQKTGRGGPLLPRVAQSHSRVRTVVRDLSRPRGTRRAPERRRRPPDRHDELGLRAPPKRARPAPCHQRA